MRKSLVGGDYDPATGLFVSVDPLVDQTGAPYFYADDDPVNESDPGGQPGISIPRIGCPGNCGSANSSGEFTCQQPPFWGDPVCLHTWGYLMRYGIAAAG
jgi:hypothetical protein